MGSIGYSDYTMLIVNYLLTECEVIAGKSQTEALTCIDRAITDFRTILANEMATESGLWATVRVELQESEFEFLG